MTFPSETFSAEFERCGSKWEALTRREHLGLLAEWQSVFGRLHEEPCRRRSGARAIGEAQEESAGGFFVVPCRDPSERRWKPVGKAFRCEGETLPDLTALSHHVDVFLVPEDFSWTLFYGHEVDFFGGPEFARADWMQPELAEREEKRQFQKRS